MPITQISFRGLTKIQWPTLYRRLEDFQRRLFSMRAGSWALRPFSKHSRISHHRRPPKEKVVETLTLYTRLFCSSGQCQSSLSIKQFNGVSFHKQLAYIFASHPIFFSAAVIRHATKIIAPFELHESLSC